VYLTLLHQATRPYEQGEISEAHLDAFDLHRDLQTSLVIRATCCSLLAKGKGEFHIFAIEAVEVDKEINKHDSSNTCVQELLDESRTLLNEATRDTELKNAVGAGEHLTARLAAKTTVCYLHRLRG